MPLHLIRSESNSRLWEACASRFLDELGDRAGPDGFPTHLWLTHRTQRDLLLEAARTRGLPGWLSPPFSFLSEFPRRFEIPGRPLGLLTGRLLLARIAGNRAQMVDRLLSELLPEGVGPDELARALEALPGDAFSETRNAWLLDTYREYLRRVSELDRFDPRSIHALVAGRIREGGLAGAIRGARRLHLFGLTSLRGRHRLIGALADRSEVETLVYVPRGADEDEWVPLATSVEDLGGGGHRRLRVQPAPDPLREARFVARSVKQLLVEKGVPPDRVAVVARSGREDTRRLHRALVRAGVPATTRLRSRLAEVPAVRALLLLFSGAADAWSWTSLRAVLVSPYFDLSIDLRAPNHLASRARPAGLEEWIRGLRTLADEVGSERGWALERAGVSADRIERDLPALEAFAGAVAGFDAPRPEAGWIACTRRLLRGDPLDLRPTISRVASDRWDAVRLDQRAMLAIDRLLAEWAELAPEGGRDLAVAEWHERLERVLASNEIAISGPQKRGVQVLEAHEAASTPFEHVFVVHANDGVFPQPPGGGPFTDAEREELAAMGLPLTTRREALQRERRLWNAVVGSPRVTVTYRTADSNGVPRLASLFVPEHDRDTEIPRTRQHLLEADADPNSLVTAAEVREFEVARFVRERRSGRRAPFLTPEPDRLRRATLQAIAEEVRGGGLDDHARRHAPPAADPAALFGNDRPLSERPTPWNGLLRDPEVLEWLERRFGHAHEWSASQLETYGKRPFDFLLQRVLGYQEPEPAEDEASRLTVGGLLHDALQAFYAGRLGRPQGDFDEADARDFERAFDEACRRYEEAEERWIGLPHVWAATREALRDRLRTFVEWEFRPRNRGIPLEVEFGFGRRTDRPAADLSGPGRDGEMRSLLLAGRVDRIDRVEPGLRVVDYKSGSSAPRAAAFEDGAALQATLYMAAVEALGLGEAAIGIYRTIGSPADRTRRGPADVDPALRLARHIPERIRRGLFEAVQALSTDAGPWQPGRDITRSEARISSGTRFDPLTPLLLPGMEEEA